MSYASSIEPLKAQIEQQEAEIERLRAENKQLHTDTSAFVAVTTSFYNERDEARAEIERLRAVLNLGGATLALFNVDNYHPTLVALQAQLLAGLEEKSPP